MSESAQHLSPQDAFARHWFPDGYPLWNPEPVLLPAPRRTEGIKIADIGVIDRDGCFDALFNICQPRDRALERQYGFPSNFKRITPPRIITYGPFRPGYVFSSPETPWFSRSVDMPYFTTERTMAVGRVGTHYTASLIEDGAYIVVPQGAKSFKLALQCYRQFESQANDHWSTWLDFAKQQLGPLRSLYLITGVCRTRSWALASFKRDGQRVEVTCELVEEDGKLQADNSRWTPLGRFASKIGPSTESQEHDNQTIFIQSLTITPNGTVRHPNREQLASPEEFSVTESGESIDRENIPQASRRAESALSMLGSWFRDWVPTLRATLTHAESATIQHVPETTLPVHPSEIVNRYLLKKHPSAEVAVTHDSTWIIMLTRGQLSKLEDLESAIDAIVSEHYNIVLRNGVVSLGNKDVSLARFGIHRSDLPVDLTDCIQQDSEVPYAVYPFRSIHRGSLRITDASVVKVAIKVIMIRATNDSSLSEKETKAQHMTDEFASLDHINVLPLIWASIEPGQLMMTFPWIERTLTSYIDDVHNKLTDIQILTLVHDVAAGLHYLHSNGIIHGCLSGAAVVVDAKGTALLADYGLATLVDEHEFPFFGRPVLGRTVRWAAPESLSGGGGSVTRDALTEKNDVYSFSGIMLQVLSGKVPYHYYDEANVASAISRRETPKRFVNRRLTDVRWLFIQRCWSDSRPSSEDIVEFAKHDLDILSSHALSRAASVREEEYNIPLLSPTKNANGEVDIIFLGHSGAGKSSLINMVMGIPDGSNGAAMMSNGLRGTSCTTSYPATLRMDLRCRLWDTQGFNESVTYSRLLHKVLSPSSPPELGEVLHDLTKQGVPILVWCIDAAKIDSEILVYWRQFYRAYVGHWNRMAIPAVVITRGSPQGAKQRNEANRCAKRLRAMGLGKEVPIVVVRRYESTSSVEYQEGSRALKDLLSNLMLR